MSLTQNKLYLWVPFYDYEKGASSHVVNYFKDWMYPYMSPTYLKSSDDKTTEWTYFETSGPTCGAMQINRDSDRGLHFFNLDINNSTKGRARPELETRFNETISFWYSYYSTASSLTPQTGMHKIARLYNHGLEGQHELVISMYYDATTGQVKLNNKHELSPSDWHHIAVSRGYQSGGSDGYVVLSWYIDGVKVETQRFTNDSLNMTDLDLLGGGKSESTFSSAHYIYEISDFRWYATILTSEEIYATATNHLVAHYPLDHLPPQGYVINDSKSEGVKKYHLTSRKWEGSVVSYDLPLLVKNDPFQRVPHKHSFQLKNGSTYTYLLNEYIFDWIKKRGMTIGCWYTKSAYGTLFSFGIGGGSALIGCNSSQQFVFQQSYSWYTEYNDTFVLGMFGSTSTFSYFTMVYENDGSYSFYNNGELIANYVPKTISSLSWIDSFFRIGWGGGTDPAASTQTGGWRGKISDVKIFNKAMTQEEIKELMNIDTSLNLSTKHWKATELIEHEENSVQVQPKTGVVSAKEFIEVLPNSSSCKGIINGDTLQYSIFEEI